MTDAYQTPQTEEEAARLIAEAAAARRPLFIQGGGSKSASFATNADILSSAGLSGIVSYNPAELVMTAKAGTPMNEIEATLNEQKQMLAFEPGNWATALCADKNQTIGGVAAANQSGSRRFVAGAARDSLLGVRFINGKGEIIKNGGRVMKNVTGLDLVKLMAGSWGALGMLTEVSFKVLPVAASQKTLAIAVDDDLQATAILGDAMATSADPSGAAFLPESAIDRLQTEYLPGRPHALIRFEGFVESVDERIERVRLQLGLSADTRVLDAAASKQTWAQLNDLSVFTTGTEKSLWRMSVPPTKGIALAASLAAGQDLAWFADWQGGLIWIEQSDPTVNLHELAQQSGGHAAILRHGKTNGASMPTFSSQSDAVTALSKAVRLSMDPQEIFLSPMSFSPRQTAAA